MRKAFFIVTSLEGENEIELYWLDLGAFSPGDSVTGVLCPMGVLNPRVGWMVVPSCVGRLWSSATRVHMCLGKELTCFGIYF